MMSSKFRLEWGSISPTTAVVAGLLMVVGVAIVWTALAQRRSVRESTGEEQLAAKTAPSKWRTAWKMLLSAIKLLHHVFLAYVVLAIYIIAGRENGLPTVVVVVGFLMTLGVVIGGIALLRRRSARALLVEGQHPSRTATSGWRSAWNLVLLAMKVLLYVFAVMLGLTSNGIAGAATGLWIVTVFLFLWPRGLIHAPPPDARRDANRLVFGALLVFCLGVVIALVSATVTIGPPALLSR